MGGGGVCDGRRRWVCDGRRRCEVCVMRGGVCDGRRSV